MTPLRTIECGTPLTGVLRRALVLASLAVVSIPSAGFAQGQATPPAATAPGPVGTSTPAAPPAAQPPTAEPGDTPPDGAEPAAVDAEVTGEVTTDLDTAEPAPVDPATLDQEANQAAAELLAEKERKEAEELEALLEDAEGEDVPQMDAYNLNFYGFVDFMYSYNVDDYNFFNPYSYFAVGRLNLYTAAELGDNWRTLLETRFTYLPHGALPVTNDFTQTPSPQSNFVTDYIDLDRPIRWGGVVIERAWLEKTYESWLNIRMGHWLTPYGIWNVDHGSPVIIGVRRPFIVGESLFPESQSGIQLHGSYGFDALRVGYAATVSNGRGPVDVYRDFDSNKALGGRLYATYDSRDFGLVTLGFSGYMGTYTERTEATTFNPDGTFSVERPIVTAYDETSLAADLKWNLGGFLLQSEAIVHDFGFDDSARPPIPPGFGLPGFGADGRLTGMYALTGYRFDFWGTMPWIGGEYYDERDLFGSEVGAIWGGFNFRPTPRVVLKAQYTYSFFMGDSPFADVHFNNLDFQAAWSF